MLSFRDVRVIPSEQELQNCSAPNLKVNVVDGRYDNVDCYLDTQFHLLREDFNCNLRDAIQEFISGSRRLQNAYVYERIAIYEISLSERGVRVKLNLDTTSLQLIRSKRLLTGSILCVSWNSFKDIVIATVIDTPHRTTQRREEGFFEVVIDPLNDYKFIELVREKPFILLTAIEPQNYFEAYCHNLRALQLLDERTLPLQRYIVEVDTNEIGAPNYLNNDTLYDLSHLLRQEHADQMKHVNILSSNSWPTAEECQMDESQLNALKDALTRELAIIQGPPGTGKTHLGLKIVETLLKNERVWDAADNNCILVCCYTNHALDQFLEGIKPFCNRLLRLGGRSSSDILAPFTMTEVKMRTRFSKELNIKIEETKKELRQLKLSLNMYLIKACSVRKSVIPITAVHVIEQELNAQQMQSLMSFTDFSRGKKFSDKVMEWLITEYDDENCFKREMLKEDVMDIDEAKQITDVNKMARDDRWKLYRLWVKIYLNQFKFEENVNWDKYLQLRHELNQMRSEQDIFAARNAKVIGATTTGAAKNRDLIRRLRPKIVIFEEAAEILEAHVVTALSEHTEHLILIGDHIQLRPSTCVYELALKFNLDVSLFERLIRNNLNYSKLKVQHRMHPNISHLLVPLFYEALEDHETVLKYENVKGITKNLFFLNHNYEETSKSEATSKSNEHECSIIASLCQHLLYQGYKQSQITVLSMYSAQYFDFKDSFSKIESLKYIRIAIVDNFQGEENDIVICSFVRSNCNNDIGFLKTPNRVNVAMSRAKIGFYAVGNFEQMVKVSEDLWKPLIQELKRTGNFGNALELTCQNHNQNTCLVSTAEDFVQFPEGCCSNPCKQRFKCGHICSKWCHISETKHSDICCREVCSRTICENGHRCESRCHYPDPCKSCSIKVEKIRKCGHTVIASCSVDANDVPCNENCPKWISCGHRCGKKCGENCNSACCSELVEVESVCSHIVLAPCNEKNKSKEDLLKYCVETCGKVLKCGHRCVGTCAGCLQGRFHKRCEAKCGRILICGHVCKHPCVENCPPCSSMCENSCQHDARCDHKCGGRCSPCLAWCKWQCEHLKCTKLCSEPCNRPFCDKDCDKKLKCGHECIGLCGEQCPSLCRICNKEELEEIFFGYENEPNRKFVQLPDCGHIFEFEGLTKHMRESSGEIKLKPCPKCQTLIRRSRIYNTEIQEALANIERVKEITSSTASFQECLHIVEQVKKVIAKIESLLLRKSSHKITEKVTEIVGKQKQLINDSSIFFVKPDLLKIQAIVTAVENVIEFFSADHKDDEIVAKFNDRLFVILNFITTDFDNNDQQRSDLNRELDLIFHVGKCMQLHFNSDIVKNEEFTKVFMDCFSKFCKIGVHSSKEIVELKENLNKAFKIRTNIGIAIKDMKMIVDTMSFRHKGHWFKCPNNHVYCITECGGASEIGKCPECGREIGGQSHRLLQSNSVATEVDGAVMSAMAYANE